MSLFKSRVTIKYKFNILIIYLILLKMFYKLYKYYYINKKLFRIIRFTLYKNKEKWIPLAGNKFFIC